MPHIIPALLLFLCLPNFHAESLKGSRPNIVFLLTDDQGYGDMSCHGSPDVKTPFLDQLHAEGTRFTDFQVSPTCSPTRSALMTGRYPFRNGVTHTILERERLTLKATTIAQVLKTAGYTTGVFGKWHLGDQPDYQPDKRGFDEVYIHGAGGIGQRYNSSCADAPGNSYFGPWVLHNRVFEKTEEFCTNVFFDGAMKWIEANKEKPFFAYMPTNAPHGPFVAPPEYTKPFLDAGLSKGEAGYYGMVKNIDDNVGRMLAHLKKLGLEEKTLFIFMGDNGHPGVVGRRFNAGQRGNKGSLYQGGTRVASFWRWKGRLSAAVNVDAHCGHIDFFPTIAELAGAELPEGLEVDGRSLLPLLKNPGVDWPDRFVFSHRGRWPRGKAQDFRHKNYRVRYGKHAFIGGKELYDLSKDPAESSNIIDQHPELIAKMKAAYEKWWDEITPMLVNEDVPYSKTRPFHELFYKQQPNSGPKPSIDFSALKLPVVGKSSVVVTVGHSSDSFNRLNNDIPPISKTDYAQTNKAIAWFVGGSKHAPQGPAGMSILFNGRGTTINKGLDQVLMPGDRTPARVLIDLKKTVDIASLVTYSGHSDTRSGQNYTLFGSAAEVKDVKELTAQKLWTPIAKVATERKPFRGFIGVKVVPMEGESLGRFRYLLLEFRPPVNDKHQSRIHEIDVLTTE